MLYANKDKNSEILFEIDTWTVHITYSTCRNYPLDRGWTWIMSMEAFYIFVVGDGRLDRDGKTFRKPSGIDG